LSRDHADAGALATGKIAIIIINLHFFLRRIVFEA
jgi:hypothetical protein